MMSDFQQTFDQLDQIIADLPPNQREEVRQLVDRIKERRDELLGALDECQSLMIDLRLWLKYLAFDREATARENA